MADLKLNGITKFFGKNKIIDNFSLDIKSGEFITLLGPSGCGKTTLLRMIAGLESIEQGELFIDNKLFNKVPAQDRHIAMVFQSYALFPHMSVKNNILFGMKLKKAPQHEMFEKLQWILPMLKLEGLENRLPREISGGQRQRVALARALVMDPEILLLDEPLSNLDTALRESAMEEIKRIHVSLGKTIVYVTHNQVEAMSMSTKIAVINHGILEQFSPPSIIYEEPQTIFASQFIGSPAAIVFEGKLVKHQDSVAVKTSMATFSLDTDRAIATEKMISKDVVISIRPQSITLLKSGFKIQRSSDTVLEVTVDLVEMLGDRSLVVAQSESGDRLKFIVSADENISFGDTVRVVVDGRKIHIFDPDTELNIFAR